MLSESSDIVPTMRAASAEYSAPIALRTSEVRHVSTWRGTPTMPRRQLAAGIITQSAGTNSSRPTCSMRAGRSRCRRARNGAMMPSATPRLGNESTNATISRSLASSATARWVCSARIEEREVPMSVHTATMRSRSCIAI